MNCLITKLEASIEGGNDNYFGGIIIEKKTGSTSLQNVNITLAMAKAGKVIMLNDGYFYINNTTSKDTEVGKIKDLPYVEDNQIISASMGSKLCLVSKYDLTKLSMTQGLIDFDGLMYSRGLTHLSLFYCDITGGGLDSFREHRNLANFEVSQCNNTLSGDIASLANCINMERFNVIASSHVNGNIASLGTVTALTYLGIADTGVTGAIEDFVSAQIRSGRSSGTIAIPYARACKITYQGVPLAQNSSVPSATGNEKFSWTSDGSISWQNS